MEAESKQSFVVMHDCVIEILNFPSEHNDPVIKPEALTVVQDSLVPGGFVRNNISSAASVESIRHDTKDAAGL